MRRAFVISFLINHKSSSAARRCSCNEKSSFHCRLVLIITGIRMPVLVKGMVPEMFFDPGHIFFRCEMGIIAVAPNLSVGVHLPDLHCLAAALKHFIQG